jgi:hypothetical protein
VTITVFLAAKSCSAECQVGQRIVVVNQLLCVLSLFETFLVDTFPQIFTKYPSNNADKLFRL